MEDVVKCPKCGSAQLSASKKGFSGRNAVAGAVLTGGIGFLAGTIGSNKVIITCLACGYQHKAGEYQIEKAKLERDKIAKEVVATGNKSGEVIFDLIIVIISMIIAFVSYKLFSNRWYIFGSILGLVSLSLFIMAYIAFKENVLRKK